MHMSQSYPYISERCRHADYEAPFQCPLDYLGPIHVLDEERIEYRTAGFLELPQVGKGK